MNSKSIWFCDGGIMVCYRLVSFLLLLSSLLYSTLMSAVDPGRFKFERMSTENGLPSNTIMSIVQDREGFLWVGTYNGVCRFDGYRFKSVFPSSAKNTTPRSNQVSSMLADDSGRIWVGMIDGLYRFCPEMGDLVPHSLSEQSGSLLHYSITVLYQTRDGMLWIGTPRGLNRLDPDRGTLKLFRNERTKAKDNIISSNFITAIHQDASGTLWIGTSWGLNRYHQKNDNFQCYFHQADRRDSLSHSAIHSLASDRSGNVWIGTRNGLNCWEKARGRFTHYLTNPVHDGRSLNDTVWAIHADSNGRLWIGTFEGIRLFDPLKDRFISIRHDECDPKSISQNDIRTICEDRSGTLWFGTSYGGLNKLLKHSTAFEHIRSGTDRSFQLNNPLVWSIYGDKDGDLWVGTDEGLNYISRSRAEFQYYRQDPSDPNSLSHDMVMTICEDRHRNIWLGTYGGGLNRFNRRRQEFTSFKHDAENAGSLCNNYVNILLESRNGALWIGTMNGLDRFDEQTSRFEHHAGKQARQNGLSSNYVNALHEDGEGRLWVGTANGLYSYDRVRRRFNRIDLNERPTRHYINDIVMDRTTRLWLGSNSGLICYDTRDKSTRWYRRKDGLPGKHVRGICIDDLGHLWISTDFGLSKMVLIKAREGIPEQYRFVNYFQTDGLQANEFNPHSTWRDPQGKLYFGGVNGITTFYPGEIRESERQPNIAITQFKLFNSVRLLRDFRIPEPGGESGSVAHSSIRLAHHQNFFSFRFTALDFTNPRNNRYAYRLVGLDKAWVYCDWRERIASYTNVDPGTYLFQVKGSNSDGTWNETGQQLSIEILPPFWQTTWFRLLMGCMMLLVIFLLFQLRMRVARKRLKTELKLDYYVQRRRISGREKEIIQLMLKGKSNRDIEKELFISLGTVKSHVHNIYKKLKIKNRVQLLNLFK